ncbi:unnamed protein product [Rotaria sordida]|uniref:Uncharacterized protein n=1 Tax=Rotaria sordida TaxID=392033 RepID=A0A814QR52_9BILA|nr:unnamed protein product [Rotaria sordida]CAF1199193.1 unnamed protein product [Rotaria sordida]CAF3716494.1 unnamed protein product [Rotaria sordida]CAF3914201.1 unnamed protein product [Rotaria sordida]
MIIYSIIFYHARRSSRRITPSTSNTMTTHIPNAKREMKLAQNMIMIETLYAAAGVPLLILILWQVIQVNSPPPESLYLLSMNSISVFSTLMIIMLFCTNKQVKDIALNYQHSEQQRVHRASTVNRQQQMLQVIRH